MCTHWHACTMTANKLTQVLKTHDVRSSSGSSSSRCLIPSASSLFGSLLVGQAMAVGKSEHDHGMFEANRTVCTSEIAAWQAASRGCAHNPQATCSASMNQSLQQDAMRKASKLRTRAQQAQRVQQQVVDKFDGLPRACVAKTRLCQELAYCPQRSHTALSCQLAYRVARCTLYHDCHARLPAVPNRYSTSGCSRNTCV